VLLPLLPFPAADSNVRSTKTRGLKNVQLLRASFGAILSGIGFEHSHRELVLKNAQFVHV
jgi:hypothetical protein